MIPRYAEKLLRRLARRGGYPNMTEQDIGSKAVDPIIPLPVAEFLGGAKHQHPGATRTEIVA